jgi:hypothetical protein
MKSIYTLVPDIQDYINRNDDWYENTAKDTYFRSGLPSDRNNSRRSSLRLSGLGDKCPRQLWYSIHHPELAETLPPNAKFKYGYGHVLENMALSLARLAGHSVEGEQDELAVDGVVGHRDAVVDGCVVDVKSCSSLQFSKFKERTLAQRDDFGYLFQLDGYILGSANDPLVHVKDKGYFLAIDKTLGHMVLYEHKLRKDTIRERIRLYKEIVAKATGPACTCRTKLIGSSGNIGLDTVASYSAFKYCCFPNLRTFLYSTGPVYLTKVVRTPDVPEVGRDGQRRASSSEASNRVF